MVYLIVSLASLIMLGVGLGVIVLTLRQNSARIVTALMGQNVSAPSLAVHVRRTTPAVRMPAPWPMQLRAAA